MEEFFTSDNPEKESFEFYLDQVDKNLKLLKPLVKKIKEGKATKEELGHFISYAYHLKTSAEIVLNSNMKKVHEIKKLAKA